MKGLLGTSMTLRWKHGESERVFCTAPYHPIAEGIPERFDIPKEEMYGEYFDIPKPDDVILLDGFLWRGLSKWLHLPQWLRKDFLFPARS